MMLRKLREMKKEPLKELIMIQKNKFKKSNQKKKSKSKE